MKGIGQEKQCIEYSPIPTGSFGEKSQKPKKCEKTVKNSLFLGSPRGYLGHKFGLPGCPIVITRCMPSFNKILRAVFDKIKFSKRSASFFGLINSFDFACMLQHMLNKVAFFVKKNDLSKPSTKKCLTSKIFVY